MQYDKLISKLFGFSIPTYYNWKRENRPIFKLIEGSFSIDEIEEFLEFGTLDRADSYYSNSIKYYSSLCKFIKIITIKNQLSEIYDNEIAEQYLNILIYIFKYSKSDGAYSYDKEWIKEQFLCEYDNYSKLYNINSQLLRDIIFILDNIEDNNQNYEILVESNFVKLVYYCYKYQKMYINDALDFCIRFNKSNLGKQELEKLYDEMQAIYLDKKGQKTYIIDSKNINCSFDYEYFKTIIDN